MNDEPDPDRRLERLLLLGAFTLLGVAITAVTWESIKSGRQYRDTLEAIAASVSLGAELAGHFPTLTEQEAGPDDGTPPGT